MEKLFYEDVTSRIGEHVIISKVRPATPEDIQKANELHKQGRCPHTIIYDEEGWMYDLRFCHTCNAYLGCV